MLVSSTRGLRVAIGQNKRSLLTILDFEKELWSALEYYSEVKEVGIELIKTRGLPEALHEEIYNYLQAFVRQAKSYYSSAKTLHYRSSSLLYYHSFLNLAKAYLLLREPDQIMGRTNQAVVHGLSYRSSTTNTNFLSEMVRIQAAIFPKFYEAQTGVAISTTRNSTLNIVNLLAYCSNIAFEYESAGYGNRAILPSLFGLVIERGTHQAWSIIGFQPVQNLASFLNQQGSFLSSYQEVSIDYNMLAPMFQLSVLDLSFYRFFQDFTPISITENNILTPQVHVVKLAHALAPYLCMHYFDDSWDFDLALSYQDTATTTSFPMNEILATYAIMFYLSCLVRYRPNYLESLLNQKPAWLIETFVNSAPEIFLRSMVCKIIGRDFVLRRR